MSPQAHILLTRPSFEAALAAEMAAEWPGEIRETGEAGIVAASALESLPPGAFVFERQRIPNARFIPVGELKPVCPGIAEGVMKRIVNSGRLWASHAYACDPEAGTALASRASGIAAAFIREGTRNAREARKRERPWEKLARRADGGLIVQFCLTPKGMWVGCSELAQLTSWKPGGVHRMAFDPRAPSRSYLKMEEALERMQVEPVAGERVVDLGAAPGGWSFSFLKRGCDVTAVDNGPMRMDGLGTLPGKLVHLREDGISFEPRFLNPPLDWLVADMLVPPGVAMGLLRRWMGQGWAKRFVVNVKIPQEESWQPLPALREVLYALPVEYSIRQLYHDRREVTVMGSLKR